MENQGTNQKAWCCSALFMSPLFSFDFPCFCKTVFPVQELPLQPEIGIKEAQAFVRTFAATQVTQVTVAENKELEDLEVSTSFHEVPLRFEVHLHRFSFSGLAK